MGSDIDSNAQAFVIRFCPLSFISILRYLLAPPGPRAANKKPEFRGSHVHDQDEVN